MGRITWAFALIFLCLGAASAAETDKAFVWHITGQGEDSYLAGSIHLGSEAMYPLSGNLMKALDKADALVLEADVERIDAAEMHEAMSKYGFYREGSLRDDLTEAQWQEVVDAANLVRVPIGMLNVQKPWLAGTTLSMSGAIAAGYSEQLGVEIHLLGLARDRMPIIALETITEQFSAFAGIDKQTQIAMLMEAVDNIARTDDYVGRMIDAWRRGDQAALNALIKEVVTVGYADFAKNLIDERNIRMADRIDDLLKSDERRYLIVIGAGHMDGPLGLVNLLREAGYEVERL